MARAWFALACVALVIVSLGGLAWAFYATGASWDHASGVFGCIAVVTAGVALFGALISLMVFAEG